MSCVEDTPPIVMTGNTTYTQKYHDKDYVSEERNRPSNNGSHEHSVERDEWLEEQRGSGA